MSITKLLLGFSAAVAGLIGLTVIFAVINQRTTRSYHYEFAVEARIGGEPAVLRTGSICAPDWESVSSLGSPRGYEGWHFSTGTELPSGRGFYAVVPDFCSGEFSPMRLDWDRLAGEAPIDITGTALTLYLSNSFDDPAEFIFPQRDGAEPFQHGEPRFDLIRASWRPLAEHEVGTVPTPVIAPVYYRSDAWLLVKMWGRSLFPASMDLLEESEELIWLDPSGRYALHRMPNRLSVWPVPISNRESIPTTEDIRRSIPLLREEGGVNLPTRTRMGSDESARQDPAASADVTYAVGLEDRITARVRRDHVFVLGAPGNAQFHAYVGGIGRPDLRIGDHLIDGDQNELWYDEIALHDREAGIFYMPFIMASRLWLPLPAAYLK